jgi:uncharacterized protein (TIGR00255 family)
MDDDLELRAGKSNAGRIILFVLLRNKALLHTLYPSLIKSNPSSTFPHIRYMLHSMTGFGRAEGHIGGRQVTAELKSLNGKGFELNTSRLSPLVRSWDMEIRSLLSRRLIRGTVEVTIGIRQEGAARPATINMDLALSYFQSMKDLAQRLGIREPEEEMLTTLLRMPEIITTDPEGIPEEDWKEVIKLLDVAMEQLMAHRRTEGVALGADLLARMDAIEAGIQKIIPLESGRMERVKERILASLREVGAESKDPNRFEQELIYYLEKMDISEEKTRLAQHCRYFREVISNADISKGKVLGFILQEIGREINTMGSKASDAGIQQVVVGMKDELEKAKEQVLNVL